MRYVSWERILLTDGQADTW